MASGTTEDRLYGLLPEVYRQRDAGLGNPLRSLLRIVQTQSDLVEEDIRQLWDDFFIETCEAWVIPYLGDLVGTTPLFDDARIEGADSAAGLFPDLRGPRLVPEVALRNRADVAKTIYYRRRKGTLPMLEELARDVTGWAAHAGEMFERLLWTQCVRNHIRLDSLGTPDLRRAEPLDRLDGPFDAASHTVDVRPIAPLAGWYGIKNVAFFLWRLRSYEVSRAAARPVGGAGDFRYHVSPLGQPAPLFTRWRRDGGVAMGAGAPMLNPMGAGAPMLNPMGAGAPMLSPMGAGAPLSDAGLATELGLPGPIRPALFHDDLERYAALPAPRPGFTDFYGPFDLLLGPDGGQQAPNSSLMILRDGVPVPAEKVRCQDLATWAQPTGQVVGVDVRRGRLAFGGGWEPATGVDVFYHYGFSADLGGGPYPRGAWQVIPALAERVIQVDQSGATPGSVTSLNAALAQWQAAGKPKTILSILDSRTYEEAIAIEPADAGFLVIEAADEARPHLKLTAPLEIQGTHPESSVTLSGLLVEGWIHLTGSLGRLRLLHTTLVPGRALDGDGLPVTTEPSLVAEAGNDQLRVEIAFSITGPLRLPAAAAGLWALDSIVDGVGTPALAALGGVGAGPAASLERVTLLGGVHVRELTLASEVIFAAPALSARRQEGCVRFSFLAAGSQVPRRYRCQPDLEAAARADQAAKDKGDALSAAERDAVRRGVERWLAPSFTSTRYGQPGYAQLHPACPAQIATGAADGSEMGAFCHLKQPQREANLRLRLEEYLPFGLEPGIVYVT